MIDLLSGICLALMHTALLPTRSHQEPRIRVSVAPVIYNSMIIIPVSKSKAIHLHHWLTYSLTLLCLLPRQKWIVVYLVCMIAQGLTYADRFDFIVTNPWRKT